MTSISCSQDDKIVIPGLSCDYRFTEESVNVLVQNPPPPCPTGTWENQNIYLNRYNYYSPVFNPKNPNQIAYIRVDTLALFSREDAVELQVFDMCSGSMNVVKQDSIQRLKTDWSSTNWLLYGKWYEDMYKVRPDGTLNIKTVDTPVSLGDGPIPIWNGSGTQMAWINGELRYHYPPHILVCGFVILDEYGVEVDTINQFCRRITPPGPNYQPYQEGNLELFEVDNWSWSPDDKKIACSARSLVDYTYVYGLFYYDFDFDGIVFVDDLLITSWYGSVTSTAWMPDSRKLVWSTERSIVQKDIDTGERKIILTSQGNHRYKNIDISPDGKTIIIERLNRVVVDGCTKTEHALYLVNSDGTDERRIIIPE